MASSKKLRLHVNVDASSPSKGLLRAGNFAMHVETVKLVARDKLDVLLKLYDDADGNGVLAPLSGASHGCAISIKASHSAAARLAHVALANSSDDFTGQLNLDTSELIAALASSEYLDAKGQIELTKDTDVNTVGIFDVRIYQELAKSGDTGPTPN